MQGFQLWLNLPAKDKMSAPTYRDIPAAEIPIFTDADGVRDRRLRSAASRVPSIRALGVDVTNWGG